MKLPYFDVAEKYFDKWFADGWLFYGIIGLSVVGIYILIRVIFQ